MRVGELPIVDRRGGDGERPDRAGCLRLAHRRLGGGGRSPVPRIHRSLQSVALLGDKMAAVADDVRVELGEILGEMVVERRGLVQLVERLEIPPLGFEIVRRLDEEIAALPHVIGLEIVLAPEQRDREEPAQDDAREEPRGRSYERPVRQSHVTLLCCVFWEIRRSRISSV